jgi:hypothetical protein
VLGASKASEPPSRDIDGTGTRARKFSLPGLHALDQTQSNPANPKKEDNI